MKKKWGEKVSIINVQVSIASCFELPRTLSACSNQELSPRHHCSKAPAQKRSDTKPRFHVIRNSSFVKTQLIQISKVCSNSCWCVLSKFYENRNGYLSLPKYFPTKRPITHGRCSIINLLILTPSTLTSTAEARSIYGHNLIHFVLKIRSRKRWIYAHVAKYLP